MCEYELHNIAKIVKYINKTNEVCNKVIIADSLKYRDPLKSKLNEMN